MRDTPTALTRIRLLERLFVRVSESPQRHVPRLIRFQLFLSYWRINLRIPSSVFFNKVSYFANLKYSHHSQSFLFCAFFNSAIFYFLLQKRCSLSTFLSRSFDFRYTVEKYPLWLHRIHAQETSFHARIKKQPFSHCFQVRDEISHIQHLNLDHTLH